MQIDENIPINVLNYLKRLDSFPNAYIAYRILLTIPVMVAFAEKKNFKIKINKILFKVFYVTKKLNGLDLLSIEKEILEKLKYKNLINNFTSQKVKKIDFK